MTTAPRKLPPHVRVREFAQGWHAIWDIDGDGFFFVSRVDGRQKLSDYSLIDSNQGWTTEADATAAFWKHYDEQPENQPPADQKYASPGYRAGYAAGLASAEGVIASLTARVAAMEGRPLGHVHVAPQPATDGEPVWIRPTIENAEPFVKPPAPPEPVVGVEYGLADTYRNDSRRWKLFGDGTAAYSSGGHNWEQHSKALGEEVESCIRTGELVPVTGKDGAQ